MRAISQEADDFLDQQLLLIFESQEIRIPARWTPRFKSIPLGSWPSRSKTCWNRAVGETDEGHWGMDERWDFDPQAYFELCLQLVL